MIDLMVEHGGWIDAGSVGYLRERWTSHGACSPGELDPHLEAGVLGSDGR